MKYIPSFSVPPRFGGRRASFKVGVIATLAIAVGANIAVLGNLGVLFGRVVPGAAHQNLYEAYYQPLHMKALSPSLWGVQRSMYDRLATSLDGRADTALYQSRGGMISTDKGGTGPYIGYLQVTPSLSDVLGVHVIAGRGLSAADAKSGAAPVIVIAEHVARERFGGAEAVTGRMLELDGKHYRVVGVLPDALRFPSRYPAAAWIALPPEKPGVIGNVEFGLHALVRPHPGLSMAAIRASLARAYTQALPDYNSGMRGFIEQMKLTPRVETPAQREYGPIITRLQLLEIAALLLLLLVFANLAGLATSDALARRHELATRVALGAGTFRLFAERARELGTLGLVGWAIGIGLGWLGHRALASVIGQAGQSTTFSMPVLLLTLAAVLVITTLLAAGGIRRLRTPHVLCADLMSGGHTTGGRGLARALRAFIVLQLAVSVVLLVMAGHLRMNVFGLVHSDLGFTPAQRTFLRVALPGSEGDQTGAQYKAYVARASAFDRSFLDRLNGLSGIKDAALLSVMPLTDSSSTSTVSTVPASKQRQKKIINVQKVSKRVAPALGLRVLAGNLKPVFSGNGNAIFLDAAAVERLWPGVRPAQAIGRSIYIGDQARRVSAVVEPLRMKPYGSVGGTMFSSFSASTRSLSGGPQTFVIHSALPTRVLRDEIAQLARQIEPEAKLREFQPAGGLVAKAYAERGHLSQVFGVLAVVALLIAAIGLFALLAYRSLVRRPEFAIRAAVGATHTRLRLMVMKEAFLLWLVGCVIGIPAAYALGRVLAANQPELGLPAMATVIVVLAVIAAITACAALVPARRATRANAATDLQV